MQASRVQLPGTVVEHIESWNKNKKTSLELPHLERKTKIREGNNNFER
jgi:hypothetical protein